MNNRREFIGTIAASTVCLLAPAAVGKTPADWDRIQSQANTFSEDDTPEQRLEKFNGLTGLSLTLGAHWLTRAKSSFGERCLMDGDRHFTGPMNEKTFMHWTAQVAFGYRLAKAQG